MVRSFLLKCIIPVVLIAILLASSWPLFSDQMFFTHDYVHGARIAELARAISDGHFPVRWSSNFGYGYGMPLFEFYAPLPFYIGGVLHLLGVSLDWATKALFLIASGLTLVGSYWLGKVLFHSKLAGLIVAATITLAPYRALNLFIRGALSEIWGITAAIWIILATVLIIRRGKQWMPLLGVAVAFLLLSHNLVTIIFLPIMGAITAVALFFYARVGWTLNLRAAFDRAVPIVGGYLLGFGLAAFYWLPAFAEKDYTRVEQSTINAYFDYNLHFLYLRQFFKPGWGYGGSEWGPDDPLSFFLGYGQYAAVLLSCVFVCIYIYKMRVRSPQFKMPSVQLQALSIAILAVIGVLAGVFLSTGKSVAIWNIVPLMSFIQFPWRYLSVVAIGMGVLAGVWTVFVHGKIRLVLGGSIILILISTSFVIFRPERYLGEPSALYYGESERIRNDMSVTLVDYIPRNMHVEQLVTRDWQEYWCVPDICDSLSFTERKVHRTAFSIENPEPVVVELPIAYYPGWYAVINDERVEVHTTPMGTLEVALAAGENTVLVALGSTPIRARADAVSLISALFLGGVLTTQAIGFFSKKN